MVKKNSKNKKEISSSNNPTTSLGSKFLKKKQEKFIESVAKDNSSISNISDIKINEIKDEKKEIGINVEAVLVKETDVKKNIFEKILFFKNKVQNSINTKNKEVKDEKEKNFSDKELVLNKKKKGKISVSRYEHIRHLKDYLEKAGYTITDESKISQKVNIGAVILVFIFSLYLAYSGIVREDNFSFIVIQIFLSWAIILPSLIVLFWVTFYFVIDFKIYNRKKELEEVLPDFLQLTSANINAGMPLDQALWYAVRPRFGILAKEIEDVAKSTLVGEDLSDALLHFSKKYDSQMLKRTINLMLEGLY